MKQRIYLISIMAALFSGCGLIPEKVSFDDPRLQPLWKAVQAVDRAALGFTPISKTADIRLERAHGHGAYDVMLHISEITSRTIAFRAVGDGYKWIHEQESHSGPKEYKTEDGTFNEQIVITYETENVSGAPLNQVFVQYFGDDARFSRLRDLTLDQVRPIVEEWDALKRKQFERQTSR